MDIFSILRVRRHRHVDWSATDYVIFGCTIALFYLLKHFAPKMFPDVEPKRLERILYAICLVIMLIALTISTVSKHG